MGNYSLIALDMDGTLLNSELQVSKANREAIARAGRMGKHIVLSTGRCIAEIRETLGVLPEIRYLVCENGARVYDCAREESIHTDPIPEPEVRAILDLVRREKIVTQVFYNSESYFNRADYSWADSCGVHDYIPIFEKFSSFVESFLDDYEQNPFTICKINLYFESEAARDRVKALLADHPLQISNSLGNMIEIVSAMADKGRGLKMLCAHLNLPVEETIAMGDSMNDLAVIKTAGLGAAMGNACPEVKDAADIIAADCNHDGVARVICEYMLGE